MRTTQLNVLKRLHTEPDPLILYNIWDPASACLIEQHGATALATSSAALAWANGYADGARIPRALHLNAVENILRVIGIPLSVDIENGCSSNPVEVLEFVRRLANLGVVGINIEDGRDEPELLEEKIHLIRSCSQCGSMFINARTDVFLQQLAAPAQRTQESVARLERYRQAGADCGFVPGLTDSGRITRIVQSTDLPINIMIDQSAANVKELARIGVRRISYGPSFFLNTYAVVADLANGKDRSRAMLSYDYLNALFCSRPSN